jgi:hypothetical protein
MSNEVYNDCVKVAACICAKDGIISGAEEQAMLSLLLQRFPDVNEAVFDNALNEFFDSEDQIEDYLGRIKDGELRRFTLSLAEVSAGADGLDIKENIALEKAFLIWGIDRHA